jgi:hypothetical protein
MIPVALARRALAVIGELMGFLDLDELCHGMPRVLREAVPAEWCALNELPADLPPGPPQRGPLQTSTPVYASSWIRTVTGWLSSARKVAAVSAWLTALLENVRIRALTSSSGSSSAVPPRQ